MQENLIETNSGNETPTNKLSEILLPKLYFNEKYQNATKAAIEFQIWGKVFKPISMLAKLIQT